MVAERAAQPGGAAPGRTASIAPDVIRALIVTNMWPSDAHPALGTFVADQVSALRATGEAEVDVFAFGGGAGDPRAYLAAARQARRRYRARRFDVVHAHFGLSAWPALAVRAPVHAVTLHGTDLVHPRSRAITLAALPLQDLVATVSPSLAERVPRLAARGRTVAVLPTGVDLERFAPVSREQARGALGLDAHRRYLLLPTDPARPEKRADRARALADATGAELITLGATAPAEMGTYINAADAVLVPSERESFGLAVLEALACEVPVLATPVGAAPRLLRDLPGTLCAPFELDRWRAAIEQLPDRLTGGRARAQPLGTAACAAQVIAAWRAALAR
jgi:teichuronic acid biosynthesis glycosyltransferase TuaC